MRSWLAFARERLLVPILLAVGGATLAVSLFATWRDVGALSYSGFEAPSRSQVAAVMEQLSQTGWELWDGGDIALFALGAGLVALAVLDAVGRPMPRGALAAAAILCAIALGILLAEGFQGDTVTLVEGTLGEGVGEVRARRDRAGGQWVALIGLVVALIGLGIGWTGRRAAERAAPPA